VFDLLHNARTFTHPTHVPDNQQFGRNEFFESFARLSGASDVADELLARRANPGKYGAWNEKDGRAARTDWRNAHEDPLRPVREYRNRLVHGRVVPEKYLLIQGDDALYYPRLETVEAYLDWRVAFAATGVGNDLDDAAQIVLGAWEKVVGYVEQAWRTHLLPSV
jgi:hypothetical protein